MLRIDNSLENMFICMLAIFVGLGCGGVVEVLEVIGY
jgi:hypothetical protein